MKRLITINIILIIMLYIIPTKATIPKEEIALKEQPTTEKIIEEKITTAEVTSRSSEEHKPIERIINLELTVDSDLRKLSNLKAEEYNKMLEGTNLYGLGSALEQAEKNHNVNGLYLMGLACLESAYRYI